MVGEASDLRLLDLGRMRARRPGEQRPDHGHQGARGARRRRLEWNSPLDMAIEVAEELGLPVMAHIDHPPPSRKEVLERLRPGDVLTHCYRPFPNSLLRSDGAVREEALIARERGVIFDIGHGAGSFGFHACRGLLAAGFRPDVISSDVHVLNIDGPAFDLLTTLSKFLVLGVDLNALVSAVTTAPASAIRRRLARLARPWAAKATRRSSTSSKVRSSFTTRSANAWPNEPVASRTQGNGGRRTVVAAGEARRSSRSSGGCMAPVRSTISVYACGWRCFAKSKVVFL